MPSLLRSAFLGLTQPSPTSIQSYHTSIQTFLVSNQPSPNNSALYSPKTAHSDLISSLFTSASNQSSQSSNQSSPVSSLKAAFLSLTQPSSPSNQSSVPYNQSSKASNQPSMTIYQSQTLSLEQTKDPLCSAALHPLCGRFPAFSH